MRFIDNEAIELLYHGTRGDLNPGDLTSVGCNSNYGAWAA
jgi:hypothetical protein